MVGVEWGSSSQIPSCAINLGALIHWKGEETKTFEEMFIPYFRNLK
jgi:hypothetical protein